MAVNERASFMKSQDHKRGTCLGKSGAIRLLGEVEWSSEKGHVEENVPVGLLPSLCREGHGRHTNECFYPRSKL